MTTAALAVHALFRHCLPPVGYQTCARLALIVHTPPQFCRRVFDAADKAMAAQLQGIAGSGSGEQPCDDVGAGSGLVNVWNLLRRRQEAAQQLGQHVDESGHAHSGDVPRESGEAEAEAMASHPQQLARCVH